MFYKTPINFIEEFHQQQMQERECQRRGMALVPRISKKMDEFLSIFRPITQRPSFRYSQKHRNHGQSIIQSNTLQDYLNPGEDSPRFQESIKPGLTKPQYPNKLLSSRSIDNHREANLDSPDSNRIMQVTFGSGKFLAKGVERKCSKSTQVSVQRQKRLQHQEKSHKFSLNCGYVKKKVSLPKIRRPTLKIKSSLESLLKVIKKKENIVPSQTRLKMRMKEIFA